MYDWLKERHPVGAQNAIDPIQHGICGECTMAYVKKEKQQQDLVMSARTPIQEEEPSSDLAIWNRFADLSRRSTA